MGTQVVKHTSRGVNVTLNFAATENNLSWSYTQEGDGEIYDVVLSNVASYTIRGADPSLPLSVTNGSSYAIAITKTTTGQVASITLKTRRAVNKSVTLNVPNLLSESVQGTLTVLVHPNDNKITVLDSSKLIDNNWDSNNWIVPPSTVIDLPNIIGFSWKNGFWDYINDRIVLAATTSTGILTPNFHLCTYHISGDKAGQIWDVTGTSQNTYNTIISDTWNNSMFYFLVDQVNGAVQIGGTRQYNAFLSNLKSWSYDISTNSQFVFGSTTSRIAKKTTINFSTNGKIAGPIAFQNIFPNSSLSMTYDYFGNNCYKSLSESVMFDNITKNVYRAYNSVNNIKVINNDKVIASLAGSVLSPTLYVSASIKRRGVIAGMMSYQNQSKEISLYNFDSVALIRVEAIVTEPDATTIEDGDYLNSIDKFIFVSSGTAGTVTGKRTIYLTSSSYDGVNPLLKQRFYVDYDVSALITNRLRY